MKIFVLGNKALKEDSLAIEIAEELKKEVKGFEFVEFDPVESLNEKEPIFMDVCKGIKKVKLVKNLKDFERNEHLSLHNYSFVEELLLMEKIGKIKEVKIIAIPYKIKKTEAKKQVKKILLSLNP